MKDTKAVQDENQAPSSSPEHQGNYLPASPKKLAYLKAVAEYGLGIGPTVTVKGDEATALYRIASGRGGPVPLFKVQNDSTGAGFMAQCTPRLHSLRHRYGFQIENRMERDPGGNKSWYWLVLTPEGKPQMKPVPLASISPARKQANEPNRPGWKSQPFSFGDPGNYHGQRKEPQPETQSFQSSLAFEMGVRR